MNFWTLFLLFGACSGGTIFGFALMAILTLSGRMSKAEEAAEVH